MVKEEKDLTYSRRQTTLKEVVLDDGTIKLVPFKDWVRRIIKDPKGLTAQRALKKKDPDLEKIKIPTLLQEPIKTGRVDPKTLFDPKAREARREGEKKDLTFGISSEAAKRRGFMPAEEGKFSGRSKEKTTSEENKSNGN